MFVYCLNNPVNGCDPCGTCFHRIDFWNDCEKCGGKTLDDKTAATIEWCIDKGNTIHYAYLQQVEIQTQITSTQNALIADATETLWDAHVRSIEMEALAQYEQDMATHNFIVDRFSTPEKTANTFGACALVLEVAAVKTAIVCPKLSSALQFAAWIAGGIALAVEIYMEE